MFRSYYIALPIKYFLFSVMEEKDEMVKEEVVLNVRKPANQRIWNATSLTIMGLL